jgi:hypothetical protein
MKVVAANIMRQQLAEDIANQLTLLEYDLMCNIRPGEFLKQRWNKSEKESEAPNLLKVISWFNKVIYNFKFFFSFFFFHISYLIYLNQSDRLQDG